MTFMVPFDGSDLAEAALLRAAEFSEMIDEDVLAISVVPDDDEYARERGWVGEDEGFDEDVVSERLRERVADVAPAAQFRSEHVSVSAPGAIATHIRQAAKEEDVTMAFIGSENAGRLVTSVSTVGGAVASNQTYDVVIVRHEDPESLD